ncbi:PPE domain-containing protein [Mycolicibacterium moriokaense]|uniref:PPE-repeat protein n=1 Tax=Mycolicibacterium moriokaense TaxID=39691 RepID=A0A318H9W7_9MYCO|nr:PPE domain-containing protein [Mycolicibacterium moriokaense]PXX03228.1 PPE-repeat protein [Mycolicibacterium moriokaense]
MVAFGDSAANPPEVNYWTLMTGDHGASATAAAAAHQALADTMATTMGLTEGNAASTAAGGWQGVGGVSMLANATEMTGVMAMAVAWLQEGSILAAQIVDAYTLALESMIPGEVCTTNRTTQAGLIATNIGQNTPAIIALEFEYRGHWIQNASMMAGYQAVVSAALAALATPPPINPAVANPAGPLAGVAQAGAETAAGSLQAGFQSVTQTAGTAGQATQAPASAATDGMSQAMSMPMQMVGQFGQMAGQLPQMLGQAPQLLSQAVQLPMGMLGQLGNAGGLGAGAPVDAASTATLSNAAMSTGGAGLGGGGGGIGSGGSGVVPSSFTRPASSFAAPNSPKLPTGFGGVNAAPEPVAGSGPSGMGSGGLYGAPAAMGREGAGSSSEKAPARTMQLTARPAVDGGRRRGN